MSASLTTILKRNRAVAAGIVTAWFWGLFLFISWHSPEVISTYVPAPPWSAAVPSAPTPRRDVCAFEPYLDELEAKWGSVGLEMSLAHPGSGIRMRRALSRLVHGKSGDKFVIGALGGSITYGHDVEDKKPWPRILQDLLQSIFPEVEVQVINGAIPATGTDYFAHCHDHHVPNTADIYLLEAAVNDLVIQRTNGEAAADIVTFTEVLVRDLLSQSIDKAVGMFSVWSVPHDYINGADKHASVAEYYDIPRISSRPFLYPYMLQHEDQLPYHFAPKDHGHPNKDGHRYFADLVLNYILRQACIVERETAKLAFDPNYQLSWEPSSLGLSGSHLNYTYDPFSLPRLRMGQRIEKGLPTIPEVKTFCSSANAVKDGNWLLQPSKAEGWSNVSWHDKNYWQATKPGATITFSDIEVSGGTIGLYYHRAWQQGMGKMKCWADNNVGAARVLNGVWQWVAVGNVGIVAEKLPAGRHSISCTVLEESDDKDLTGKTGKHTCKIIAVVAT